MTVLNFSAKLEEKQKADKLAEAKTQFMEVFHEASAFEQQEILESMKIKDMDRYKQVTNPIIMRLALKKFN